MTGTRSSAVLNVTTLSSTPGRLSLPWPHSGATPASAFYERSDLHWEPDPEGDGGGVREVRRVRGGERQLDFVKNASRIVSRSNWPRLRKRPPGGPTTTFMTLISERCFRLQLWDYFFSSKCNIFLLLIQIYEARAESGPGAATCLMTFDLLPPVDIMLPPMWLTVVTVHWCGHQVYLLTLMRSLMGQ